MRSQALVLAVDRNRRNLDLLAQTLAQEGYQTLTAASHDEVDQALERLDEISLVLIDMSGFDQRMLGTCDRLRQAAVPFLMISPRQVKATQQTGLEQGARGVLVKPLVTKEFLRLVRSLLEA